MALDRTNLTLGNASTQVSVTYDNTFKGKINELLDNAADVASIAGFLNGLQVDYASASSVTIAKGQCQSDDNSYIMNLTAPVTVNFANGVGVANGSDAAEATSTWYYVWLIAKSSDGTVAGLLSTSSTNPTLPTGYDKKRLLPIALRNDSSGNIIPYQIGDGWPSRPSIIYNVEVGNAFDNTATTTTILNGENSTSFEDVPTTNFIPPVSKVGYFRFGVYAGSVSRTINFRPKGTTHNGFEMRSSTSAISNTFHEDVYMGLGTDQMLQYKTNAAASTKVSIWVLGFVITDIVANNSGVLPVSQANSPLTKGIMNGCQVSYVNASTVQVATGICRDADDTTDIEVTSPLALTLAGSGLGGLDTSSEAENTWYYVWLVKNSTTGQVGAIFSTSSSSPVMPSGYDKKRLLPIAVRNDGSSNIIPFYIHADWPNRPTILYNVTLTNVAASNPTNIFNAASNGVFTDVDTSNFVPSISKIGLIHSNGSDAVHIWMRPKGETNEGVGVTSSGPFYMVPHVPVAVADGGFIQVKGNNSSTIMLNVAGFVVTDVDASSGGAIVSSVTKLPKDFIGGLVPTYLTSNTIKIGVGSCRDDSDSDDMVLNSDITLNISTTGKNGRDAGTDAANTWYYVWMIKNPDTKEVAGLFSTSRTAPTLPTGFTLKRMLPVAIRNDGSSDFIPFMVADSWPSRPLILYRVNKGGNASSPTSVLVSGAATTFTDVSLTSYLPPISMLPMLKARAGRPATGSSYIRGKNMNNAYQLEHTTNNSVPQAEFLLEVDSTQTIQYQALDSSTSVTISVSGFVVTEVNVVSGGNQTLEPAALPHMYSVGLNVQYKSSSSMIISVGECIDDTNFVKMSVTSPITVDFANGVGVANGLDTGVETANTWYYVWLIKHGTNGTVAGLLSASYTNPTLPEGYTHKRLLKVAARNDASSNFFEFFNYNGRQLYRSMGQVVTNGTANTKTTVSTNTFVPPISKLAIIMARGQYVNNSASVNFYFANGSTTRHVVTSASSGYNNNTLDVELNSSQQFAYAWDTSTSNQLDLFVTGYEITEVV